MHSFTLPVVFLLVAACNIVSGIEERSPFIVESGLSSRQVSGIDSSDLPSQCESSCTAIVNTINSCTDMTCLCTSGNSQGLAVCVDCILGSEGTPTPDLQTQAQSILDNFASECSAGGVPISTDTVSASAPSSGGSTSASDTPSFTSSSDSSSFPAITGAPTSQLVTFTDTSSPPSTTSTVAGGETFTAKAGTSQTGSAAEASASGTSQINPPAQNGAGRIGGNLCIVGAIGLLGAMVVLF